MEPRLAYTKAAPSIVKAMMALEQAVHASGLEPGLLDLVKVRTSQINGCAVCLNMHIEEAQKRGESATRLYELDAWRETPLYSDRERAALAWTEAVTLVAESRVPDEVYEEARKSFSESELVLLTLAVVAINGWNRLNIAFRAIPAEWAGRAARAGASRG